MHCADKSPCRYRGTHRRQGVVRAAYNLKPARCRHTLGPPHMASQAKTSTTCPDVRISFRCNQTQKCFVSAKEHASADCAIECQDGRRNETGARQTAATARQTARPRSRHVRSVAHMQNPTPRPGRRRFWSYLLELSWSLSSRRFARGRSRPKRGQPTRECSPDYATQGKDRKINPQIPPRW
jgi:hypothetical protein